MEKQDLSKDAKSNLTKLAAWIDDRNVPFLITSIGMIVMLLWAGSYKMTAPGAEGIVPLVSNSPLIWWHFKLFGPYIGSDIIGLTELAAAILIIAGYMKPKAGIIGDRKSTRLNSSHQIISYAVFCLKKKIISIVTRLHVMPVMFHITRKVVMLATHLSIYIFKTSSLGIATRLFSSRAVLSPLLLVSVDLLCHRGGVNRFFSF